MLEDVLDDLAEHVCNRLPDLFVDSLLHVLLRVVDVNHLVGLAPALQVKGQHVVSIDTVAVARVDVMLAFAISRVTIAQAALLEVLALAQTRLLAVKLGDGEVASGGEDLIFLLLPVSTGLMSELPGGLCGAVCEEHLCGDRGDDHLVGDRLHSGQVGISHAHVGLGVTTPLAFLARAVGLVPQERLQDPVVALARVHFQRIGRWIVALHLPKTRRRSVKVLGQGLYHLSLEQGCQAEAGL